jgi:DHA2 family multidrug resistance protein
MTHPQYFKEWINNWSWGVRIALFLILMSSLIQFGIFAMTQNYMLSLMGLQTEDMSFAMQISYVGILSALPIQFRFLRYFETRNYLIVNIITGVLLSLLCIVTRDINIFFVIRFFQGMTVCNIAGCMVVLIYSRLKTEHMQAIGSTVFYGSIFSNGVIIGIVGALVVMTSDWTNIYLYSIIFQIVTLFIVLLALRSKSGHKSYPLYQIDWKGFIIFVAAVSALTYTMIYGSKYYWLQDERIRICALMAVCGIGLFIYRQLTIRRPLIDLSIFKSRNFVIGLLLLAIYYGFKDSINLIYGYTGATLQWSPDQVMLLGICNVAGLLIFMILSAQLIIRKRHAIKGFLMTGFSIMVLYHLWMYFIFTPDLSFTNLIIPVFLQGASSGLLFVPIVIFTLSSAPKHTGTTGIVIAACTRFTATLNSIAGFYNLQLFFNKHHKMGMLNRVSNLDFATTARLESYTSMFKSRGYTTEQATSMAYNSLTRALDTQSQMLTYRSIFLMIAIILVVLLFLILAIPFLNQTVLRFNKRMFTLVRK